jgi:hypothetical protein
VAINLADIAEKPMVLFVVQFENLF